MAPLFTVSPVRQGWSFWGILVLVAEVEAGNLSPFSFAGINDDFLLYPVSTNFLFSCLTSGLEKFSLKSCGNWRRVSNACPLGRPYGLY